MKTIEYNLLLRFISAILKFLSFKKITFPQLSYLLSYKPNTIKLELIDKYPKWSYLLPNTKLLRSPILKPKYQPPSEKTQITFKVGQIFYISSLFEEKSSKIVARLVNYSSFKAKYNRTIVEIYLKLKPHPPLGKKSSSVVDPKSPRQSHGSRDFRNRRSNGASTEEEGGSEWGGREGRKKWRPKRRNALSCPIIGRTNKRAMRRKPECEL